MVNESRTTPIDFPADVCKFFAMSDSSPRNPQFVPAVLLWLLGSTIAIVSIGADLIAPNAFKTLGRDFTNMWTGGQLALSGDAGCAFDVDCFRLALLDHVDMVSLQNFSYPPHTLFIDAPFALLPYGVALAVWTLFGMAFFAWAARFYLPANFPPILAVLTPAATINIWDGQYGFLFGGLWLLTFRWLEREQVRAGIMAALLTFKPHLGVLLTLVMLFRARWRTIAIAVAGTIALIICSGLAFGPDTWIGFLTATGAEQIDILTRNTGDFYYRMMPTAYPRFGWLAQAIFAALAIACLWRVRRVQLRDLAFPTATATFLVLPYAFNYDMTVASLGYAILLHSRWSELSVPQKILFAAAFVSPQLTYFLPISVPIVLSVALFEQVRLLGEPVETSGPIGFIPGNIESAQTALHRSGIGSESPPTKAFSEAREAGTQ